MDAPRDSRPLCFPLQSCSFPWFCIWIIGHHHAYRRLHAVEYLCLKLRSRHNGTDSFRQFYVRIIEWSKEVKAIILNPSSYPGSNLQFRWFRPEGRTDYKFINAVTITMNFEPNLLHQVP